MSTPTATAVFVPLANGIRWMTQEGGLRLGGTVVIAGPGQHGLGCVLAARQAGAARIIVIGTDADRHRLEVARALGADHTLAVVGDGDDVVGAVLELTGGTGAEVVVDLAPGVPGTVERAVEMCAPRGTVVLPRGGRFSD